MVASRLYGRLRASPVLRFQAWSILPPAKCARACLPGRAGAPPWASCNNGGTANRLCHDPSRPQALSAATKQLFFQHRSPSHFCQQFMIIPGCLPWNASASIWTPLIFLSSGSFFATRDGTSAFGRYLAEIRVQLPPSTSCPVPCCRSLAAPSRIVRMD